MEPQEQQKNELQSRAKEIDTGAIPLPMSNVLLGLPYKPDPTANVKTGAMTQQWTYADLFSQKKLVADLKVDTNSAGTIWSFVNTWENVINLHAANTEFRKLFGLKSWTLNFMFEFRSNFQQVGQILINYSNLPKVLENYHLSSNGQDPHAFNSYKVVTQLPHRKIPMGEDQDCNVALTWLSPHSAAFGSDMYYWDGSFNPDPMNPYYDMGTLRLSIPFPMEVASGVDSVMTIRIWSFLSDFKTGAYRAIDKAL